jgi:hypothetical protein
VTQQKPVTRFSRGPSVASCNTNFAGSLFAFLDDLLSFVRVKTRSPSAIGEIQQSGDLRCFEVGDFREKERIRYSDTIGFDASISGLIYGSSEGA